jgi:Ca2+-binding EF-hand superfamily protein
MDSTIRPSSSSSGEVRKGLPKRPSTALGLSSSGANMSQLSYSFNRTRPPFDSMIPPPPREESEPVCMETLQKIRNKVYERAINLKTVFRRFDEDKSGTVSRAEFKKALAEMNLDFPSKVVNGLLDALDSDGGGEIEYNEFAAMLKTKDTLGEYNPFLLERTYFDGSCAPDDTHKRRNTKIKAKDVDRAYKLHDEISKRFYQRYRTPQHMFRDIDDNSNGAISSEEFAAKLKFLQIEATPEDIDNMIDVFQMSQPGQLIYRDFVEHFHQPDKWGFCSAYNPVLPLGKNGEKNVHPPIDSSTMQKTHWDKEGRPHPFELLKQKKQMLKDCVAEAQPLVMEQPTHTIVLPGKTKRGLLDKYLLEELRRKFTTMRKSTRDMFHILDPGNEGRISRDNFHKGMKRLNMGIPDKVLDELISFVDSDNCGYVEMPEFVELIEPSVEDMRIPKHNEDEIAEIDRLMSKPPSRGGMPPKEIHPLVQEYLRDGELKPSMLSMIQTSLEGKSSHLRNIFLKWDIDQDGFIDATELRKGLSSLNLGIPEGVIARIVNALDTDGNGKLDYNEFVGAFRKPDNLAGTNAISHERSLGHRFDGHGRNSFHDFVNFNSDSNSQGIAMPSKMKDLDTATILKTALAQHATWGGMPPAGLIKGNAAKTLDLNLHRIGYYGQGTGHDRIKKAPSSETSSRDLNASDKTAKVRVHWREPVLQSRVCRLE